MFLDSGFGGSEMRCALEASCRRRSPGCRNVHAPFVPSETNPKPDSILCD